MRVYVCDPHTDTRVRLCVCHTQPDLVAKLSDPRYNIALEVRGPCEPHMFARCARGQ